MPEKDVAKGGAGGDVVSGGAGRDMLFGGSGNDLVIYDRNAGDLFIDFDGKGGAERVKFAKVDQGTEPSHGDFGLLPLY